MSRDKQIEKNSLVLGWEFAYQNDRPCIVITKQTGNEIYILCSSFESEGKIELEGYAKASEVAREIFDAVDEMMTCVAEMTHCAITYYGKYAELKKKYTEELK